MPRDATSRSDERRRAAEERAEEAEADNIRLREQLKVSQSTRPNPTDYGLAGRAALTRLIETDLPAFIDSVENLPRIYENSGLESVLSYGQTVVRARLAALSLTDFRTPELVIQYHRIQQELDEPALSVMMRSDRAGARSRRAFMDVVVRIVVQASVRAVFNKSTETPAGLLPPNEG